MEEFYYRVTSSPWIIFAVGFFVYILFSLFKKRKHAEVLHDKQLQERKDASAKGMQVTSQRSGSVMAVADGKFETTGETQYEGTTGGIAWKLTSEVLATSHGTDDRPGRQNTDTWKRTTRLTIESIRFPAGKFLMLMSTPGFNSASKPIKRGGFLNKLVNMAADFALDFYVAGYFGAKYKSLVGIGVDSEKIERQTLQDFMILSNRKPLAEQFLNEATSTLIANWKKQNQGFSHEGSVDHFGLLFAPDGMVLGCQANMASADEVKMLSDFACVLAVRMKESLQTA